jgi:hypothetical protein
VLTIRVNDSKLGILREGSSLRDRCGRSKVQTETGPSLHKPSRCAGAGTPKKAWQSPMEEARPSPRTESASGDREVFGLLFGVLGRWKLYVCEFL